MLVLNVDTLNPDKVNFLYEDLCHYPNLDIVCIVEPGLRNNDISQIQLKDYSLINFYCRSLKKCGGVAIWVKNSINAKKISVVISCIEQDFEFCAISFIIQNVKFIVVNCYRSPSGNVPLFLNKITDVLNILFKPNVKIIVCGDFNLDCYKNQDFKVLSEVMSCFNLIPLVKWPTRVTATTCTLIDNIFTNYYNSESLCCVFDNYISDHRSVYLALSFYNKNISKGFFTERRNFNENNISRFMNSISCEKWVNLYCQNNVDDAFQCFCDIFNYYFDICFPKHKVYNGVCSKKSWVNIEVKNSSQELKYLYNLKQYLSEINDFYKEAKKKTC